MRNNGYTSRLFNSSRSMLLCLSFIICHLSFSPAGAQELEAKITINHSKVQGSDASVFDNLQQTLEQFVNERQWTELQFQKNERIVCNFNITVDKYVQAENRFECSAIIQANRPVYNSAYTTTIYNNTDKNFQFTFAQFDQLNFNDEAVDNQLTALFAYYAYTSLAWTSTRSRPWGAPMCCNAACTW